MRVRHRILSLVVVAAAIALPSVSFAQATTEKKTVGRGSATLSAGIQIGNTLYLSGQLPPNNMRDSSVTMQTEGTINTIKGLLEQAGFALSDVVQATVYLADINDFSAMNAGYSKMFATEPRPTRTTVAVAGLVGGAKLEITVVAVKK
jgi:2-iminobutanoate/2-iminopropanoate deaminase